MLYDFDFKNLEDLCNVLIKDHYTTESSFKPIQYSKLNYPYDLYETDYGIYIEIAAIGIDKDDINVSIENNKISFIYDKLDKDEKERNYFHKRIINKSFNFTYKVDSKFDLKNINVSLDKGLLKVFIPISKDKKKIEVKIN